MHRFIAHIPLGPRIPDLMLTTRIEHRTLSTLCERVGIAFETGLDPYRVFEREAKTSDQYGRKMRNVATQIKEGAALSDAIKDQGNFFPPHFAEMIEGGEKSGKLDQVLERLSQHYGDLAEFRAVFLNSIVWPLIQAGLGILVVALLIYLPAVLLPDADPERQDLIGIGLVGERGLVVYTLIVGSVIAVILTIALMVRNGWFQFLGEWCARLPWIGHNLKVFAEARFIQTLALAIESGVDASSAISLSFRSAGTGQFTSKADDSKAAIEQGRDMHSVLDESGLFQEETIEVVEFGEASGKLAEMLDKHFKYLKAQVRGSMAKLTYLASAVIWFFIAAILVMIIFRVFSLYVNNLGDRASSVVSGNGI